jgi:osmoprotectant transport system ATP-binding protein
MIELQGVSKSFGGVAILPTLNLSLHGHRTTVLIGPSGCGKSTLLRLIVGLIRPDTGTISIDGAILSPETATSVRRSLGYVIQDGGLFPHLSARENAALMARHLGWKSAAIEARLHELAELTRFPIDGLDRFPTQVSGGQRQRVSLIRALMLDPTVILLDEPLGALDPMVRAELQVDLRAIFRELRKTVVMVTHDLGEAGWFGDDIILMRDGRVIQRGLLSDFLNTPADPFVSRFVQAQRQVFDVVDGGRS